MSASVDPSAEPLRLRVIWLIIPQHNLQGSVGYRLICVVIVKKMSHTRSIHVGYEVIQDLRLLENPASCCLEAMNRERGLIKR